MKEHNQVFREHLVLVIEGRLFLLLLLFIPIVCLAVLLYFGIVQKVLLWSIILLFFIITPLTGFVVYHFWYRCFGKLVIRHDEIVWRCAFMNSCRIQRSECYYAGIESFTEGNIVADVHNSGFRSVFISTVPYPTEYRGRINLLHNSDHFIKFPVSAKLCICLADWLPDPQNRVFISLSEQFHQEKRRKERIKAKKTIKKKK